VSALHRRIVIVTGAIVALHLVLRALGCAEHASVLAGMVRSPASLVLGPLHVLCHLFTVIVAPIVAIATIGDLGLSRLRRKPAR
jgi:hypothetical protein